MWTPNYILRRFLVQFLFTLTAFARKLLKERYREKYLFFFFYISYCPKCLPIKTSLSDCYDNYLYDVVVNDIKYYLDIYSELLSIAEIENE